MEAHERYEELAVGHVLGGLTAPDAAQFRSHLLGCRDCRLRVAELRDIAAHLAAAEREERAEARVRTEVARRTDPREPSDAAPGSPNGPPVGSGGGRGVPSRFLGLGIAVTVVIFGALAFWNLHLRTQTAVTAVLIERQEMALAELATGITVAVDVVPPASGLVVVDDQEVAFSFVDLPPLVGTERYVVWLTGTDDGEDDAVLIARADDRRVAGAVEQRGADDLVVTVEDGPTMPVLPTGRQVVAADLAIGTAPRP